MRTKNFNVISCAACPNLSMSRTQGAGYAIDYVCSKTGNIIKGYVEWSSEGPQPGEFPDDCPLPDGRQVAEKKMRRYPHCTCDMRLAQRERCDRDIARCASRAQAFVEEAKQNKTGIFKEK